MTQLFANAARTTLASGISGTDTTLTVALGDAFPVANTGASTIGPGADWFKAVLDDGTNIEVVYVRTHTSNSETFGDLLRGQEGTTAVSWSAGAVVGLRWTALDAAVAAGGGITLDTPQATTGGTTKDFTIPSGTRRITCIFNGTSVAGSAEVMVRIGTGSTPAATGYTCKSVSLTSAGYQTSFTTGFGTYAGGGAAALYGTLVLDRLDDSAHTWICSGVFARGDVGAQCFTAGQVTIGGELDIVRFTTSNGTDAFDAGSVNVSYQ